MPKDEDGAVGLTLCFNSSICALVKGQAIEGTVTPGFGSVLSPMLSQSSRGMFST